MSPFNPNTSLDRIRTYIVNMNLALPSTSPGDTAQALADVRAVKHELAVRDRQVEILEQRWLGRGKVDSALYQAHEELEPKPGTHITRHEALDIAKNTSERCELEREQFAFDLTAHIVTEDKTGIPLPYGQMKIISGCAVMLDALEDTAVTRTEALADYIDRLNEGQRITRATITHLGADPKPEGIDNGI